MPPARTNRSPGKHALACDLMGAWQCSAPGEQPRGEEKLREPNVFDSERDVRWLLGEDVLDMQVKKQVKQYGDQKQRQGNEGHDIDLIAHCLEVFH